MAQESGAIIIADRNPHIRAFLRREMLGFGRQVLTVGNWAGLSAHLERIPVDLVVVSTDLPDAESGEVLKRLAGHDPVLNVLVHAHDRSEVPDSLPPRMAVVGRTGAVGPLLDAAKSLLPPVREGTGPSSPSGPDSPRTGQGAPHDGRRG